MGRTGRQFFTVEFLACSVGFDFNEESKTAICSSLDLSTEHFDRVLYRAKERLKQLINDKEGTPKGQLKALNKNKKAENRSHNISTKIRAFIKQKTQNLLILLKVQILKQLRGF